MKNYFNSLKKSVWVVSALCLFASCSDVWENHYSTDSSVVPDKTIAERIESVEGSENFIQALKTTKMFNGNKILDLTYYDFLSSDQFLTVWMPSAASISEDEWALYTKENKTYLEHKEVAQQFIMNHIARFSYPVGQAKLEKVRMLSKKRYNSSLADIDGIEYIQTNLACTNGILHLLDGVMPYRQTIYEYITETEGYKDNLGAFFEKYTIDEIDENRSVVSGVDENGEPIYIDSVTYKYSIIMSSFGRISEEDSNYVVVLPTPETWVEIYDSVKKKYDFTPLIYVPEEGSGKDKIPAHFLTGEPTAETDSLTELYTHNALFTDMFFNMNIMYHPNDSVMSTLYYEGLERYEDEMQHKYYNPYDDNGIFKKNVVDSIICSNGKIYLTDGWTFNMDEIINRDIKIEGESSYQLKGSNNADYRGQIKRDEPGKPKVSEEYVMQISGVGGTPNYDLTYYIPNNRKGKFKLGIVTVRDSEFPNPENLPVQFLPTLIYNNLEILKPVDPNRPTRSQYQWTNIENPIDTLWVPGVAEIPQCNTGQTKAKLEIKIDVKTASGKNPSSNTMFLDCIILRPVADDYEDPVIE